MRLVDADAIPESATAISVDGRLYVAWSEIVKAPAIEAEPVKHGEWVSRFARRWKGRDQCSECGFHEKDHRDLSHYNYCPNCGAKMDVTDTNVGDKEDGE